MVATEPQDLQPPPSARQAAKNTHRTSPDHSEKGWPGGVPYIIGNEGCERFSYYGMRAILWMYIAYLFQSTGLAQDLAETQATVVYHTFAAAVYAFPMIGAMVADRLLGKYRTILYLSMVYTAGHAVLSFTEGTVWGMYTGLGLIAVGSGGIKPCVSAHVGDQFGRGNFHLLEKMYQAFYFIINFGSFFSTLMIPWVRKYFTDQGQPELGWTVAFAIPGVLMGFATWAFWLGRKKFVHIPAMPGGKRGFLDALAGTGLFIGFGAPLLFADMLSAKMLVPVSLLSLAVFAVTFYARTRIEWDDGFISVLVYALVATFKGTNPPAAQGAVESKGFYAAAEAKFGREAIEGQIAVWKILSIFAFIPVFWALFDQHSSTWIQQAQDMNRNFFGYEATADQIPALNPLMVMAIIPFLTFGVFPFLRRLGIEPTPLRRMSVGMLITAFSFVAVALIQRFMDGGTEVHVGWQILPYLLITFSEVLVSVTGLEFAYTQAPKKMKSTVMGLWLLMVTIGNKIVALLAAFGDLKPEMFFWVFAALMGAFGLLFALRAKFYVPKAFTQ